MAGLYVTNICPLRIELHRAEALLAGTPARLYDEFPFPPSDECQVTGLDSGIVRIERPALSDRSDTVPDLASKIKTDKPADSTEATRAYRYPIASDSAEATHDCCRPILFQSNARMMPPNRKALAQSTQGDQSDKGSGTDSAKKQIDNGAIEEEIEGGPAQDGAIENGIGGSMRDDSAKVGDREIVSGMKDKSKAPVKDGRRETSNHFDLGCDADVMERAVVHSDFDSEGIVYDT
ncbi:hypothetical protein B0A48_06505 [Cryoendolithus antarcticus]|uniref:Uncharacterized protein n=1 Tax=Cryoendolithus antarcticus TaxID=1507870 RepID=A0A1V8TB81_9PEZI|nr:hypothetical protein B0A48_06505 [Cryoendolithus antarcticus]